MVIAPELFGRAFGAADAHGVLRAWQAGGLAPVANRSLLKCYLAVLRGLGVEEEDHLRGWIWIWTRHPFVRWDGEMAASAEGVSAWQSCQETAIRWGATLLVSEKKACPSWGKEDLKCVSLSEFPSWRVRSSGAESRVEP